MCGIAGVLDLTGGRVIPEGVVEAMARALIHRGPDEEGYFRRHGVELASRRLSIVGLADGQQPVANEDRSVRVVFNGELFDYIEQKAGLEARGHRFVTHCDTEIIPHLWEESLEGMFARLRGQFAVALWDERRRKLVLGRDRFGICPLYWTRQGDWLLFGSEIKALLASGMVPAQPDLRGIDHIFTFSALPAPVTCFAGIQLLPPAHYLEISLGDTQNSSAVRERAYWEMDFPDEGQEERGENPDRLVDEFERLLLKAIDMRLRADVPVGAYLSGGVDSSMIVAMACHVKGPAINTYTIRVDDPELDELSAANLAARHIGTKPPVVQEFRAADALETYPRLIQAAEAPVIDTSCAALLQLAGRVHACGQKVVLTGEGADEWLIGYPWYKAAKLLEFLDVVPGLRLSDLARRAYLRLNRVPQFRARGQVSHGAQRLAVRTPGLMPMESWRCRNCASTPRPCGRCWKERIPGPNCSSNVERAKRWHPLNRGIWVAARVNLAGHLLQAKGDRVAMHSSVEVRYPFLDEDVFAFLAKLHPRWKLRGFRDKHLLRLLAERWLPPAIFRRGKVIFRAPLDSFHIDPEPAFVGQLLSEESLRRTGYFDVAAVRHWRRAFRQMRAGSLPRLSVEMGLAAVVATQLWHHLFIDGNVGGPAHLGGFRDGFGESQLIAEEARRPQRSLARVS